MIKSGLKCFFPVLSLLVANSTEVFANASVTAATGGGVITADMAGRTFTALTGPKLTETDKNGIGLGSIILTAPAGFEFNPASPVTVAVTGNRKGTDLVLSNSIATVTTNTITVYVAATSSPNARRSMLTWSGIRVRPIAGAPLAAGRITKSGTSAYAESGSIGNYGLLTEVPGAMSNLVVTLPNQTFTSGLGLSGTPSVQTAGVSFNLTRLTATDRFLNIVTNYTGTKTISYAGSGGMPAYTTEVAFTNGQSTTKLATILYKAETTTITVSDGTTTGPASSPLTVNRGGFAKLQVLLPGETAAPGTPTGKTGIPAAQTAGSFFPVSVRAVDENWNLVESVTDTVGISLSDANASLPSSVTLSAGAATFSVALPTAGQQTVTVSNLTATAVPPDTSPSITVNPAAFQRLQLLLPGETAAPGTVGGKTGIPTGQTAGVAFTVTVHSVDTFWNVVPASDFVGITSSDANATLPDNSALFNGTQSFCVVLNTLGLATVTAGLLGAETANDTSPEITVSAGSFTKLQLLVPGEVAVPGTPAGKTGTALPHGAGASFPVTVNAVDADWNLIHAVTDIVHFASSDGAAVLPADAALAGGTGSFNCTLGTAGSQTITVSDLTDGSKMAGTSAVIRVGIAAFSPATGGELIPADTAGGTYTFLNGPVMAEGSPGNIGAGTLILTVPSGFVVNTGNTVLVTVTGAGSGTDVVLGSATAVVSATSITITVDASSTGHRASTLTWSGIQVRPVAGAPLAGGCLSNSGTAVIFGVPAGQNFGTLMEVAGTATRLVIETQPSAVATAGVSFARQPVIHIEDQFGNLCVADDSTVVSATRSTGAGVLQGSVSALAFNGVVSFMNLSHEVAGAITVAFSASGLVGTTSATMVISPASASQVVFIQPPTDTLAGSTITPAVSVQVQDVFGNDVPDSGVPVSITLGSGVGILSGATSSLTDASGRATFHDMSLDRAGLKTLTAAMGPFSAASGTFTIHPAAADHLVFIQPPIDVVAGMTMSPAVTVQRRDAFDNDVAGVGVPIALSLSAGGGTLDGILTQVTDPNGLAVFDEVSIAAAGVKGVAAVSPGLTSAVSGLFTVFPGDYTRVQLLLPGETVAPGTTLGKTGAPEPQKTGKLFTVTVNGVDVFWNRVDTVSNTVVLSSSDSAATLPAGAALVGGSNVFTVVLSTGGDQTLTAEDFDDVTIADDTSPAITVAVTLFALQVVSVHGTPVPSSGLHTVAGGSTVTNVVTSPETQGGAQYVCTGWVLTGNAPFHGTSNSFVMTCTNDSRLTWLWTTNYRFHVTTAGNGSVMGSPGGWYPAGESVTVTAAPSSLFHFTGWTGDVQGDTNSLGMSVALTMPRSIGAAFAADLAAKGTPLWCIAGYGLTNGGFTFNAAETNDMDGDLAINAHEYVADTDPTNSASCLRIALFEDVSSGRVYFPTSSNRLYGLQCSTNLVTEAWLTVTPVTNRGHGGLSWLSDTNTFSPRFYRVGVLLP
jgi:hypothetical protein